MSELQWQTALYQLRSQIISGDLIGGAKLRASHLAAEMGVSRTPIGEALIKLEGEGLLIRDKSGFTVRSFALDEVYDAINLRGLLEGAAVQKAAERGVSEVDVVALRRMLAEFDRIVRELSGGVRGSEDVVSYETEDSVDGGTDTLAGADVCSGADTLVDRDAGTRVGACVDTGVGVRVGDGVDAGVDTRVDTIVEYDRLNLDFHNRLVELSDSSILIAEVQRSYRLPFAGPSAFPTQHGDADRFRASLTMGQAHHHQIVSALENREGARVFALMCEHARLAHQNVHAAIEARENPPQLALVKNTSR